MSTENMPLLAETVLNSGCHVAGLALAAAKQEAEFATAELARAKLALQQAHISVQQAEVAVKIERERAEAALKLRIPTPEQARDREARNFAHLRS